MKKLWRQFRYNTWLLFGGRRTEKHFVFLSKEILKLRGMISELRSEAMQQDNRLWELEDHTPEEGLARCEEMIKAFGDRAGELLSPDPAATK